MTLLPDALPGFLSSVHPYDTLSGDAVTELCARLGKRRLEPGETVYSVGEELPGLYIVQSGQIDVFDATGQQISTLGPRNSFGERGLMRDGVAVTTARATEGADILMVKPAGYQTGTKYPTILYVHGGPNGQDQHSFAFDREFLAANGDIAQGYLGNNPQSMISLGFSTNFEAKLRPRESMPAMRVASIHLRCTVLVTVSITISLDIDCNIGYAATGCVLSQRY